MGIVFKSLRVTDFCWAMLDYGKAVVDGIAAGTIGAVKDCLEHLSGTYPEIQQVLHYFDQASGLNIMMDLDGNLIGGWKLSNDQIKYLLSVGAVK